MVRLRFWSDDHDMDLLKVIPTAEVIIGDLANVEMWTTGHKTFDRLNHPDVWNSVRGTTAFFGTHGISKPESYWSNSLPVQCTAMEMFRDTWMHHCEVMVNFKTVWNTGDIWPDFKAIMWSIRGLPGSTQTKHDKAVLRVTKRLRGGVDALRRINEAPRAAIGGEK